MTSLTHFDDSGASRMVDVGDKPITRRVARAEGRVTMAAETLRTILDKRIAKGDVFEVARLAGIMAAKETSRLIPLCHILPLSSVKIQLAPLDERTVRIEAEVRVEGQTGVEMEALTAVTVCALTIYDMCKAIDRSLVLGPFVLVEKSGGKSGTFLRTSADSPT
ncbi:MAG: cyclic pyranopterin monophosphate synthase MoaC [Planctomycetota bacterium]|nr:cyclic pyranopterin monophosphate synthase MoaC [Planctomycetota bacterium]